MDFIWIVLTIAALWAPVLWAEKQKKHRIEDAKKDAEYLIYNHANAFRGGGAFGIAFFNVAGLLSILTFYLSDHLFLPPVFYVFQPFALFASVMCFTDARKILAEHADGIMKYPSLGQPFFIPFNTISDVIRYQLPNRSIYKIYVDGRAVATVGRYDKLAARLYKKQCGPGVIATDPQRKKRSFVVSRRKRLFFASFLTAGALLFLFILGIRLAQESFVYLLVSFFPAVCSILLFYISIAVLRQKIIVEDDTISYRRPLGVYRQLSIKQITHYTLQFYPRRYWNATGLTLYSRDRRILYVPADSTHYLELREYLESNGVHRKRKKK